MRQPEPDAPTPDAPEAGETDGRRRRGLDNRARIVAAMIDLVEAGELSPSAEQVAARADVGLRTVFRHFQEMDALYLEMSNVIGGEVRAIMDRPLTARDWRGRVLELIDRRAEGYERLGPFKRAANAYRHRSRFLGSEHEKMTQVLRRMLEQQLPADGVAPDTLEILDTVLSFEAWSRLRQEQGLDVAEARRVLASAVRKLLA